MAYRLFCGLLAAGAAFGLTSFGAASAVLIPGDQAGAFAEGSITSRFLICTTCTPAADVLSRQDAGGVGNNGPAIVGDAEARGTGKADYGARAIIVGPFFLPELGAEASAFPGVGPHAGFSGDGAYFFTSGASAHANQYFTYIGQTPETYTIAYSIRGQATSAIPEDEFFITLSATIALFDDRNRSVEFPKGHEVAEFQKTVDGENGGNFDFEGDVSITVNRGDSFYVSTFLDATVTGEAEGIADAAHTLTTSFSAGDTSLLRASLPDSVIGTSVPEPSTWALMIAGFGLVGGIAARRSVLARRRAHSQEVSRAPSR
jgi:PEP-CTERM motif